MTLRRGSQGVEVKRLQKLLGLGIDGIYGAYTEKAVREFQLKNGLNVDGVVGTKTWELLERNVTGLKKSSRKIDEIIVHCTATPEGRKVTVAEITVWHKQRGFSNIGYHYVVYLDGSIHLGRDVNVAGAHTTGHNANSIGVCYVGGVAKDGKTAKDTRTEYQKLSLRYLLKNLKILYPNARIYGHRDFANKACPSFDAKNEYKYI